MYGKMISIFGHTDGEFYAHTGFSQRDDVSLAYSLKLFCLIEELVGNETTTFITGLQEGIDLQLAHFLLCARRATPDKQICLHAIAVQDMDTLSKSGKAILSHCDTREYIKARDVLSGRIAQERRMIDLSTHVFSVLFSPEASTALQYAKGRNLPIFLHDSLDIIRKINRKESWC